MSNLELNGTDLKQVRQWDVETLRENGETSCPFQWTKVVGARTMYRGIWGHLAAPPPIHPPLTELTATVKTVTASPFSVLHKHVPNS